MATETKPYVFILSIGVCCLLPSLNSSSDGPVVHTNLGAILGKQLTVSGKYVDAFYGIPYAVPPVRELRFKNPVPVSPWKGIFSATKKPLPCWQFDLRYTSKITMDYLNRSISSEDCLYLNVWRPASLCSESGRCDARLPVIVFLYGGAFQWGDSSLVLNNPENFVALSDVIYVTFNYRLGIFGFLSSGTKDLPGNMGLWDQNLALKWVQSHIGSFGGNRDDVTLWGFSAGAISAGLHAISPQSRDLFHRLILQSSTPLSLIIGITLTGTGKFLKVAGSLGCFEGAQDWSKNLSGIIRCLQNVDAQDVYRTLKNGDPIDQLFSPLYNDEFLPDDIFLADTWKSLRTKEIFLGSNPDEGSLFLDSLKFQMPQLLNVVTFDIRLSASVVISTLLGVPMGMAKEIVQAYFGDNHVEHDEASINAIVVKIFGDVTVDCPTNLFAEVAAEQGISVYRYIFSHRPSYSLWPKSYGITHMDDLPFTLGFLTLLNDTSTYTPPIGKGARSVLKAINFTSDEVLFMKELTGTWTTFVKTGKPSIPSSKVDWPKYNAKTPECIFLQPHNYTQGLAPRRHVCELWRPILLKKKPVAPEASATTPKWTSKPTRKEESIHNKGSSGSSGVLPSASTSSSFIFIAATLIILSNNL
ncbi:acetylcholinesterase, putative [Ixodes scapularis]|uniref:Carboxylic ester hydrolase n=1 Tax=Ixodes scapularis TaxID=6945 RepID=B7PYA0_IXOSC|nr:acetylcholinesterase, putative [Ixodes scapularis]|eukprot:XP_002402745.1 acetylcholinesterase, putative [Ixodes scapularis]